MKLRWLSLVVALQAAWLVGTALTAQNGLVTGRVIRLETRPVDPRDLLRGDYLTLAYDFSRIPLESFAPPLPVSPALAPGSTIYVELAPDGEFYRMTNVTFLRPRVPEGHVILRGKSGPLQDPRRSLEGGLPVEFGLERFYVREGTGNPQGKLTVDVSVSKTGIGTIREVYLDGVPYAEAMAGR